MNGPSKLASAADFAFQSKLAANLLGLSNFLAELHSSSDRDQILAQVLKHLQSVVPIEVAGFYFPQQENAEFVLGSPLEPQQAAELNELVSAAIDAGTFGWALKRLRPATFRTRGGGKTLVLSALRTRQQLVGMFAAVLKELNPWEQETNAIILATHLACTADVLLNAQLTAELQDHNRRLDSIVNERTEQLVRAKEAAEIANSAKTRFLAMVSHELRTPLNAILGYAQILRESAGLTSTDRENLQTVHTAGEHLLSLVNDLMDVARAETETIDVQLEPVALDPFLKETQRFVIGKASAKGLSFQVRMDRSLPNQVRVDSRRLRQVLVNLLGNAVKFTESGSIRLSVEYRPRLIRFEVTDTGYGMTEEEIAQLGKPFQQFGNHGEHSDGFGLGLSITKRLLRAMGSELCVRSRIGAGTSFWFDLPCQEAASVPIADSLDPQVVWASNDQPSGTLPEGALAKLIQFTSGGDILALQSELTAIVASSAGNDTFASELLTLAKSCNLKAVKKALHKYETNHPHR